MFNISKLFGKPAQDLKMIYKQGARVVDVRGPEEFKAGHFEGATNIPLESIGSKTEFLRKQGKPIILVCRSGARSSMATSILKNAGLEVYNGGGWTDFSARLRQ